MNKPVEKIVKAAYNVGEEIMNSITHGFGIIISSLGAGAMITLAAIYGDVWQIVSASIFSFCMILLYSASTAYHSARSDGRQKDMKIFDTSLSIF